MKILSPPLTVIETRIFGPSDELMESWVTDDPTLPPAVRDRLEADPDAQKRREQWLESLPELGVESELTAEPGIEMPAVLREMIAQKIAVRIKVGQAKPVAGQILRIDGVDAPEGSVGATIAQPLAVLIDHRLEDQIWAGWLVSSEIDYASSKDLLLDEQDEPFDPLVAMIQVWNPVRVSITSTGQVLAKLSPERLSVVRDMVQEGDQPNQLLECDVTGPGAVMEWRTSTGRLVLTGTPLGEEHDPRRRYQELYRAAAMMITRSAPLVATRPSLLNTLITQLTEAAQRLGESLTLRPLVPQALGEKAPKAQIFQLGDVARIEVFPPPGEDTVQVRIEVSGDRPLRAWSSAGERVLQTEELSPEHPRADFFLALDKHSLHIEDESGAQRLTWLPRSATE